jgi:hypothetical protein
MVTARARDDIQEVQRLIHRHESTGPAAASHGGDMANNAENNDANQVFEKAHQARAPPKNGVGANNTNNVAGARPIAQSTHRPNRPVGARNATTRVFI